MKGIIHWDNNAGLNRLIRNGLIFSLMWHVLAAWFSTGYYHPDEHFQIIEFAGYKLGFTTAQGLPWEFPAQLRPALQPAFLVLVMKLMGPFADPFAGVFIVKLFAALLGWVSVAFLLKAMLPEFQNIQAKRFLVLFCCFFWVLPLLHAHYSAESLSGSLFFCGIAAALFFKKTGKGYYIFISGAAMGLAFVCRPQSGFLIAGFLAWLLFVQKSSFKTLVFFTLPAAGVFVLGLLADRWFYGNWVLTMYNYYKVNLVQGKAAEFGVAPWWHYFEWSATEMFLPLGVLIIAAMLFVFARRPFHILSLCVIPFILVHMLIGHKEDRFLFPVINAVPFLAALAYQDLISAYHGKNKVLPAALMAFWGINIVLLVFFSCKPMKMEYGLFRYLYAYQDNKNITLVTPAHDPYGWPGFKHNFYYSPRIRVFEQQDKKGIESFFGKPLQGSLLFLFYSKKETDAFLAAHHDCRLVYCNIPGWVRDMNLFHWADRTSLCYLVASGYSSN